MSENLSSHVGMGGRKKENDRVITKEEGREGGKYRVITKKEGRKKHPPPPLFLASLNEADCLFLRFSSSSSLLNMSRRLPVIYLNPRMRSQARESVLLPFKKRKTLK